MVRIGNQSRSRTAARSACAICVALCAVSLLTSCNSATVGTGDRAGRYRRARQGAIARHSCPDRPQVANATQTNAGERGRAAVFEGTEIAGSSATRGCNSASSGNGYDLNFENTPIATVAKVVLGDILNTGYIIDPRVQGTVSLVSVRPVPKSDIVFVLESALRLSGVVLVRDGAGLSPDAARRRGRRRPGRFRRG